MAPCKASSSLSPPINRLLGLEWLLVQSLATTSCVQTSLSQTSLVRVVVINYIRLIRAYLGQLVIFGDKIKQSVKFPMEMWESG